jgi:hypothetical protein
MIMPDCRGHIRVSVSANTEVYDINSDAKAICLNCTGTRNINIHPLLIKLTILGATKSMNMIYDHCQLWLTSVQEYRQYTHTTDPPIMRVRGRSKYHAPSGYAGALYSSS